MDNLYIMSDDARFFDRYIKDCKDDYISHNDYLEFFDINEAARDFASMLYLGGRIKENELQDNIMYCIWDTYNKEWVLYNKEDNNNE